MPFVAIPCPSAYVVDGESLRDGDTRLRLFGIDAPEVYGCPRQRVCVDGDGAASRRSLALAMRYGPITSRVVTLDRYGRSVVMAGRARSTCPAGSYRPAKPSIIPAETMGS